MTSQYEPRSETSPTTSTAAPSSSGARSQLRGMSYAAGKAMLQPKAVDDAAVTTAPGTEQTRAPSANEPSTDGSRPRRLYFAIAYTVTDRAFERAAETWAEGIRARADFDPTRDLVVVSSVQTEGEFRTAWSQIKADGDREGWVVQEGHVFSHASKGGDNTGLEFRRGDAEAGTNDDGTLGQDDIGGLPALNWASDGHLSLSSCNSGLPGTRGWSPAQAFADAQGVRTSGEMGYAYFSSDPNTYQQIDDDTENVYLNAYRRRRNGIFGWGGAIPDGEYEPSGN